ncbi:MAG TPA: hypothetical protein V6D08_08250 [Candidatus Obscuribacterales bacterium]
MPEIFQINATLPIFVVSFLLFLYLLNKVMLEPVGRAIAEREARVKADLEAGKASRAEAETVLNQYHQHLAEIRSQAQSVINEAVEKANYHRNMELGRVREEGDRRLAQARAEIASERDALIDSLVAQEQELVGHITAKLLGEPVSVSLEKDKVRRALEEAC